MISFSVIGALSPLEYTIFVRGEIITVQHNKSTICTIQKGLIAQHSAKKVFMTIKEHLSAFHGDLSKKLMGA